jgi:transcriptional regulator GlxA family with amidase domain
MKIAFVLFHGITLLDLIGIYDPITRLKAMQFMPDLEWDICSFTPTVEDSFGLEVKATRVGESLAGYDVIVVPGGHGTRTLQNDEAFINWIKTAANASYKLSICSGSLILGAAGFLKNKRATTHFAEYDVLQQYCGEVIRDRIVEDGDVITAGAVSSSIDLGLYLCEKWTGSEAQEAIRKKMDYHG